MLNKTIGGLVLFLFLLSGLPCARGSNAIITGRITGADGDALAGVTVTAAGPEMPGKVETTTGKNGVYRMLDLMPGTYSITCMGDGFRTVVRRGVEISPGQTLDLPVVMEPGDKNETITRGGAPRIDVKSATGGMTLRREAFLSLPRGRAFDSLVTLTPGVHNSFVLGGTSVHGASGLENMYYMDGTDITDIVSGGRGQSVSFDFVDHVRVMASGYPAEFAGALGGVIQVVTRSGGNEFRGEVMGYYSGAPLRAAYSRRVDYARDSYEVAYFDYKDYIGEDKDHRFEAGFALGGYILKDKLWFFGAFLPVFYTNTRTVTYPRGEVRDWERTENHWNVQVKLTARPVPNLRLSASLVNNFHKYKGELSDSFNNPDPLVSFNDYGFSYPNLSAALSADLTAGNNFLLSLRGGYFMRDVTDPLVGPSEPCWRFNMGGAGGYENTTNTMYPEIPDAYIRRLGWRNSGYPYDQRKSLDEKYGINADLTYFMQLAGTHAWKMGVQFLRQGQDYDQSVSFPVIFLAWDKDLVLNGIDYGRGTYGYYGVRGAGDAGPFGDYYKAYSNRWAVYIQDSWTLGRRLTLNFGLRAESEYLPSYSDHPDFADVKPMEWGFGDKLAPRLGFVYDVNGDSRFKIFGSFGIYYDVMKLAGAADAYGGYKWKTAYYPLNTYEWDRIGVEGWTYDGLLTVLDYRVPDFSPVDPDLKPRSQREFTLGVEKQLAENIVLSVRVVSRKLLWSIDEIYLCTPRGTMPYTANPGGDFIKGVMNESKALGLTPQGAPDIPKAKRDYRGVNISVDKRFSDNWLGGISYTWSRLRGNDSGCDCEAESYAWDLSVEPIKFWYLNFDKYLNPIDGPLPGDRTHQVKAFGAYTFDFGLTLGAAVNAMSGTPVSTEYFSYSGGYLPFNRGDLGRTPFLMFANLYAEYNLKLGDNTLNVNITIDNLFNTRTAMHTHSRFNIGSLAVSDEQLVAGNWDINTIGYTPDPLYGTDMWFYGDGVRGTPFSVRLGVKYMF